MGGHPQQVCSRIGGRGRHRALRCRDVAVRARRRERALPDLRQRALALRAAPGGHRARLPSHVLRPYAGSKDAAVTLPVKYRSMEGGAVDELLDVTVERPVLEQLKVEVGRTLED